MFFSTYVLTKRGPLAKVWLAAHWDKRLTRHEVKVVDLSQTILHIVRPVVPIALRTSGELLVGVVRIYALKVKHLLKEATEATLFLRVTTLATKGPHGAAGISGKASAAAQQRTTSVDGVVVPVKGSDVDAVTFDWSAADISGKHDGGAAAAAAAAALGEGRFDAIADLLGGAYRVEGAEAGHDDALLASAWYTVQPTSQGGPSGAAGDDAMAGGAGAHASTQQDYDEIAKMRADLMAFGERASGSASTSKSKSSLSSMEKGRGSVAVDADGNAVAFAGVGDELDIGVPLPDELPPGFPALDGAAMPGFMPVDPFLLPDVLTMDEEGAAAAAAAAAQQRPTRRPRPVNVCDVAATTLSREAFEKCMADRSDTLNTEPRRGPYDAQEEADRFTVTGSSGSATATGAASVVTAAPLSAMLSPALRLAFAAALQPNVQSAAAAAAAARRGGRAEEAAAAAHVEEGGMPLEDGEDGVAAAAAASAPLAGHKRSREDGGDEAAGGAAPAPASAATGVSTSALHTLERIRAELAAAASAARAAQGRRKAARAEPTSTLVGSSCALRDVCRGLRRRDAARTFVDVLALASKQLVRAQALPGAEADVQVTLNESALRLLATA